MKKIPSHTCKYDPGVHNNLHGSNNAVSSVVSHPPVYIPGCLEIGVYNKFAIVECLVENAIDCISHDKT